MSSNEMFCRLDETHITEDGDYIPKGTPVRVLYWSSDKQGLLRVETTAHIYADSSDDEHQSFVGHGMLIDVNPNLITFSSFTKGESK
jgi:hypothetical protein